MFLNGIPKGKHIFPGYSNLLKKAGVTLEREHSAALTAKLRGKTWEAESLLLSSERMLMLLARGVIQAGVIGDDKLRESGADVETRFELCNEALGLPETRIVLFAGENDPAQKLDDIPEYSTILTEYERLTKRFFEGAGLAVQTTFVNRGVEAEVPRLRRFGVALVDSGATLKANRLKEICTITTARPVFAVSKIAATTPEQYAEINCFARLLQDAARS